MKELELGIEGLKGVNGINWRNGVGEFRKWGGGGDPDLRGCIHTFSL